MRANVVPRHPGSPPPLPDTPRPNSPGVLLRAHALLWDSAFLPRSEAGVPSDARAFSSRSFFSFSSLPSQCYALGLGLTGQFPLHHPDHLPGKLKRAVRIARIERLGRDAPGEAIGIPGRKIVVIERRGLRLQRAEFPIKIPAFGGQLGHRVAEDLLCPPSGKKSPP